MILKSSCLIIQVRTQLKIKDKQQADLGTLENYIDVDIGNELLDYNLTRDSLWRPKHFWK